MTNVFFAKLKPFHIIAFTEEYKRLALIDYESDEHLLQQQYDFLSFYRENVGRWALFRTETNGYTYALDSDCTVIVSLEWLENVVHVRDGSTIMT